MNYTSSDIRELEKRAADVRANILEMLPPGKVGHLGGSASAADIAAALYFKHMRVYGDPKDPRRDRCIFSKGHAVLAQYACLVELGYFDRSELGKLKTLNGILQGHPDNRLTPGIEAVTGSLGQGLSISVGMALGLRLAGNSARIFCVIGDGELAEGQIWEAAMAASAYGCDNVCAILDLNGVQATGRTEEVFPIRDIREKWDAFGWHTAEIDGHDMEQILRALEEAGSVRGKPSMIIAHTIKGKGFAFAENRACFHNGSMTEAQYRQAVDMVNAMRMEA